MIWKGGGRGEPRLIEACRATFFRGRGAVCSCKDWPCKDEQRRGRRVRVRGRIREGGAVGLRLFRTFGSCHRSVERSGFCGIPAKGVELPPALPKLQQLDSHLARGWTRGELRGSFVVPGFHAGSMPSAGSRHRGMG